MISLLLLEGMNAQKKENARKLHHDAINHRIHEALVNELV